MGIRVEPHRAVLTRHFRDRHGRKSLQIEVIGKEEMCFGGGPTIFAPNCVERIPHEQNETPERLDATPIVTPPWMWRIFIPGRKVITSFCSSPGKKNNGIAPFQAARRIRSSSMRRPTGNSEEPLRGKVVRMSLQDANLR